LNYREAASQAGKLTHSSDPLVSRLGVRLLQNLAKNNCFLAIVTLYYLTEASNEFELDKRLIGNQFESAIANAESFIDPSDVYDAAHYFRFREPARALNLYKIAAEMGLGIAAYEVCDMSRQMKPEDVAWLHALRHAAALGASEAMAELGFVLQSLDKSESEIWLKSAAHLGNLRARELLGLA
jgi:TPR repeat protein